VPASVPRPPFARARVWGSGESASRLTAAVAARAARVTEWVGEDDSGVDPAGVIRIAAPRAAADVDLVLCPAADLVQAIELHPGALFILVSESLADAVSAGGQALERAPGRFLATSHAMVRHSRPAEEPADEDFVGVTVALAPIAGAPGAALAAAERFWLLLGAVPLVIEAAEHDRRMALTDWLPRMCAAALAGMGAHSIAPGTPEELLVSPAFLTATATLVEEDAPAIHAAVSHAPLTAPLVRALARELDTIAGELESPMRAHQLGARISEARAFRQRFPDA